MNNFEKIHVPQPKSLEERWQPFINYWKKTRQNSFENSNRQYCILTKYMGLSFEELITVLREGNKDILFVHGVNLKGQESYGIICTDNLRQIAENSEIVFIGEAEGKDLVVLSINDLNKIMGTSTRFRVGVFHFMDKKKIKSLQFKSFMNVFNELDNKNQFFQ